MKRIITRLSLCALTLLTGLSLSAQNGNGRLTLKGRTANPEGAPVDFATVVLMKQADTTQVYGAATDGEGLFSIKAPRGDYRLRATFLGYEPLEKTIKLEQNTDLGDLVLQHSAIGMEAIVVKGEMITREADRFVVNVGNTPAAIGQTAKEMLQISPGVWVDEKNGVSINGKSNPQVIVNDRIIRETGEDLINYLNTIKAEDILRIEVIPMGGVEYDASAQGGIIKITLKRQRENGLEGSVTMRYGVSLAKNFMQYIQPSFNLNYMVNKFRFYTTISENNWRSKPYQNYVTRYDNGDRMESREDREQRNDWPSFRVGTIYDINAKHSVGIEANLRGFFPGESTSDIYTKDLVNGKTTYIDGSNNSHWKRKNLNLTANYIAKLDTVGSTFKLLFDYYRQRGRDWGNMSSQYTGFLTKDSITDNRSNNLNSLYSVTGDFEIKAGKSTRIKTGLKYSYRDVNSANAWNYYENDVAFPIPDQTFVNGYTENIAALYGSYSASFKNKMSLSVGLRGEYTYATPLSNTVTGIDKQDYFSFFPNANLSVPLNKKESHTLIFSYSRKINRPWYSNLIPRREALSENMYFEGNPHLKPAYSNDYSISWVFKKRYNLTLGVQQVDDALSQVITSETVGDVNVLIVRPANLQKNNNFYMNLNVPVEVTPWWKINANLMGGLMQSKAQDIQQEQWAFMGNLSNTFTLTKNLYYSLDGRYRSPMIQSTMKMLGSYEVNTGFKYSFAKNKFTANVYVNDVFNSGKQRIIALGSATRNGAVSQFRTDVTGQWNFRRLGLALRYNFKSGKEFRVKNVETGEGQEGGSGKGGGGLGQ